MAAPTLEYELKKLLLELKELAINYKENEEKSDEENKPQTTKLLYRGKKEAYNYSSNKLKNLLHWHGIIDLNDGSWK